MLDVTIPPNSQATIHLPAADATSVSESGKALVEAAGITPLSAGPGVAVLRAGSGTYRFESKLK
jgi:alpha-L-rhamnosidase